MKSSIYTLILLDLLLVGCSDRTEFSINSWTPSQKASYLSINPSSLTFGAGTNLTQNTIVSSVSTPWRIDGECSWITLSKSEGTEDASVNITALENTDPTSSRNAIYSFTSCDSAYPYSKQLLFNQNSPEYQIIMSQNTIVASAAVSKQEVVISANAQWTCKADVNWLHAQKEENRIVVSWDENTSSLNADRIGHIDVTCGNTISTITVNQQPPYISSTTKSIDCEAEGGAYQLDVKSDVSWSASTSQSWINISPQGVINGDAILYLSATPNSSISERTGNVYLYIGGKQLIQIPISQKGLFFEVDKSYISFGQQATTSIIEVNTNTNWQVISKPDFIDVITPSSGKSGTTKLSITVSENLGGDRSGGSIVLGNPSVTGLTKTIAVSQAGYDFKVSETNVTLQAFVTRTHEITIVTNANWFVEPNADWLHVSQTSGYGYDIIILSADVNPSIKQRSAKVMISTNTNLNPIELNITQKGQNFTVSSENLSYTSKGGTNSITVNSDCESFDINFPSWITMSKGNTFNAQSARLSFIAQEYSGEQERRGEVIIGIKNLTNGEKFERKINIVQYPLVQTIGKDSFDNDVNWNLGGNNNMTITVTGFGSDIDWNF